MTMFPKPSGREYDPDFRAFVVTQRCAAYGRYGARRCAGRVQGHHAGRRPLGRKCDDKEMIPLCEKHHREIKASRVPAGSYFVAMTKNEKREWQDARIVETQVAFAAHKAAEAAKKRVAEIPCGCKRRSHTIGIGERRS